MRRLSICFATCRRNARLARLRERQIPIEISLTSNVRTGAIAALADHPLKSYIDLGLMLTLNTDDPDLFGATLVGEYQIAQQVVGLTDDQLQRLAMNSFEASFLPEARKREYLRLFSAVQSAPALLLD